MAHAHTTIATITHGLGVKDFSVTELTKDFLIRANDSDLGAFVSVREDALKEAKAADERLAGGQPARPLEGVPVAVKDNMLIQNEITTAGSNILADYRAMYTATAVERLQAAGAIVIGKTNLDEFAMGASTENSAFHPTKNPWDPALVPGGSSGGSAVAVAADQAVIGIGSDTGGSIRQPAAFCNVVGMKPTYGRVSRYGLIALASSLDQIGPLARTVEDAAMVYQTMAGMDACDASSSPRSVDDVLTKIAQPIAGLRIGLPKEFFSAEIDPNVASTIAAAIDVFRSLGAMVEEVSIPHAAQGLATYYVLQPAEASSNLARFDGIRYGLSVRDHRGLQEVYARSREQGFGAETKRRIMIGTFALSAGYSYAYYEQANRVRAVLTEEFDWVFDRVDILLSPTSPIPPFPIGEKSQNPLAMYLADLLTVPANLAGIPALSLPGGFHNQRPVGLQLMANHWDEGRLFQAAYAYQQATTWHQQFPSVR